MGSPTPTRNFFNTPISIDSYNTERVTVLRGPNAALIGVSSPAGPSLKGVAGRKIAAAPGFAFSSGLKAKGGTWTDANLDAYMAAPSTFAPGTRMFARVAQPQARAAIIGYLKSLN